ncbi:MAG TPA: DUF4956 domain-containing protein [Vicinamibacterales bacterium]|jgi:uncharacterized membrane protein YhiD involved in acid resistance
MANASHRRHVRQSWLLAGSLALTTLLVLGSFWYSPAIHASQSFNSLGSTVSDTNAVAVHPLADGAKLLAAAFIGIVITLVQRQTRRDQPLTVSMEQAHILLCVAGALTMIVIGSSVARAFGIAGAASIIRFRTPIEDPRDVTVLFLLMALGMAAGLGFVSVAGIGTLFLAACLLLMHHTSREVSRSMKVALVMDGRSFPEDCVLKLFAAHHVRVSPLEISHGDQTTVRYRAVLDPEASLEDVSTHLLNDSEAGIKSVSWESPKKGI